MVKRAVRVTERPIGGSRGQLEGLRGPMRFWSLARRLGGQPGGLEAQAGGNG